MKSWLLIMALFLICPAFCRGGSTAGNTDPGQTADYKNAGMQLLAQTDLKSQNGSLLLGPLDGFVYYATYDIPSIIKKIRLSDMAVVKELKLDTGQNNIITGVLDPAGFGYFGTYTSPGIVVKVRLSDMTLAGVLTLDTGGLNCSTLDPVHGYVYFGTWANPAMVVKIRLSDFKKQATLALNNEFGLVCAMADPSGGYLYFGTHNAHIIKVRLSDFSRVGTLDIAMVADTLGCGVIDPAGGYSYFSIYTSMTYSSGNLVRVRLSDFTVAGTWNMYGVFGKAAIDVAGGFAYFAYSELVGERNTIWPGGIVKVRLSDSSIQYFQPDMDHSVFSPVLDTKNGYIYAVLTYYFMPMNSTTHTLGRIAYSYKNTIHANKITLPGKTSVADLRFYAHAAPGKVQLALYDNSSPMKLIWQSIPTDIVSTGTWTVTPRLPRSTLAILNPGTYWLAWQTDSTARVPGYAQGNQGDEFQIGSPFGNFPAIIDPAKVTYTNSLWSMYLTINPNSAVTWSLYR